ncbi:hypothetical protein HYU15_02145 [Candidatus Woesearchaeota archaeon]|nr:hypothetical protein [Candidatus Woesearchaeota archaeon]
MTETVSIPVKRVNDEKWLILSHISSKGLVRAVRIDKRKKQVLDWDGHHCDEASASGSVRYCPRGWDFLQ